MISELDLEHESLRNSDRTDWPIVRFGDVVRNVKDSAEPETSGLQRYVAGEHMDTGDLHIRRWGTIGDGYLGPAFHRKFEKGQVLYGSRRTYLRKVALAEFDGICANTTFVLEPSDNQLLPELLPFVMQTEAFTEHSVRNSKGSVNPYVNWKDIASFEFALPSKPEQHRIAQILWAADRASQHYVELLGRFDNLEEALISNWTRKLLMSNANGGTRPVRDIAEISYGVTLNAGRRSLPMQMPYLRVANLGRGELNLSEIKLVGVEANEVQRYALRQGDLLVVEGHANIGEIGRAAMWNSQIETCLHQNHLLRIRCSEQIAPAYLLIILNSNIGKLYFQSEAKSTSGLNTINSKVLGNLTVPLPAIDQQEFLISQVNCNSVARKQAFAHLCELRSMLQILRCRLFDAQKIRQLYVGC